MPVAFDKDHVWDFMQLLVCDKRSLHEKPQVVEHHVFLDKAGESFAELKVKTAIFVIKKLII